MARIEVQTAVIRWNDALREVEKHMLAAETHLSPAPTVEGKGPKAKTVYPPPDAAKAEKHLSKVQECMNVAQQRYLDVFRAMGLEVQTEAPEPAPPASGEAPGSTDDQVVVGGSAADE